MDENVKLIFKRSTDLSVGPKGDLKEKVNIVVSYIIHHSPDFFAISLGGPKVNNISLLGAPNPSFYINREIFDSELLGEGVIPSVNDALDRLVDTSSPYDIVPAAANIFGVLIECHKLETFISLKNSVYSRGTIDSFLSLNGFLRAVESLGWDLSG